MILLMDLPTLALPHKRHIEANKRKLVLVLFLFLGWIMFLRDQRIPGYTACQCCSHRKADTASEQEEARLLGKKRTSDGCRKRVDDTASRKDEGDVLRETLER